MGLGKWRPRLRYRYLDLRRPEMLENQASTQVTHSIRNYLDELEFIETPFLSTSLHQKGGDYLCHLVSTKGHFYLQVTDYQALLMNVFLDLTVTTKSLNVSVMKTCVETVSWYPGRLGNVIHLVSKKRKSRYHRRLDCARDEEAKAST